MRSALGPVGFVSNFCNMAEPRTELFGDASEVASPSFGHRTLNWFRYMFQKQSSHWRLVFKFPLSSLKRWPFCTTSSHFDIVSPNIV